MTPFESIQTRLRERGSPIRPAKNGFQAQCPAHDDVNPSLSVREGEDGRVLLHCHAGCATEDVLKGLGMSMKDLFEGIAACDRTGPDHTGDRGAVAAAPREPTFDTAEDARSSLAANHGQPDQEWPYLTSDGEHIGSILRWDLPDGRKRIRPISQHDGRWQLKGMATPRPLYNLRAVLDSSPETPVYVAEGEKAADALSSCGLVATTSAHGSKAARTTDWSPLAGRAVIVVPDLDDAGAGYARTVAGLLRQTGAASVQQLNLRLIDPDLPESGDAADLLATLRGDGAAVREAIESARAVEFPPSPAENRDPPHPFPTELLPAPLCEYVRASASCINCDEGMIAGPLLGSLAGVIGNTCCIQLKSGWTEPSILWILLVADSGGAKTPALQFATNGVTALERSLQPETQRLQIDDCTPEAVARLLRDHPRGLLLNADEAAMWLEFDRYATGKGAARRAVWLKMFEAKPHRVDRLNREHESIERATVSVVGGIQPEVLARLLSNNAAESGLVARILFILPEKRPQTWTDQVVCPELKGRVHKLFNRLWKIPYDPSGNPRVFTLEPTAQQHWIAFHNKVEQEQAERAGVVHAGWAKIKAAAARIALVHHLSRIASERDLGPNDTQVSADSVRAGIALAWWFGEEMERLYRSVLGLEFKPSDSALLKWIRDRGGSCTVRDLARGPARYRDSNTARTALEDLVQRGHGLWKPVPGGRTLRFVLNSESVD